MNSMKNDLQILLDLVGLSKQLRFTLRWQSGYIEREYELNRHESVAEHISGMIWLLTLVRNRLGIDFDFERAIRMILIHDFPEVETGDETATGEDGTSNGTHHADTRKKAIKFSNELIALNSILYDLSSQEANQWIELWDEYEQQQTELAKLIRALDRIDAIITIFSFPQEKVPRVHGKSLVGEYLGSIDQVELVADIVQELKEQISIRMEG